MLQLEEGRRLAAAFGTAGVLAEYHASHASELGAGLGPSTIVNRLTAIGEWGALESADLSWRIAEIERLEAQPMSPGGMVSALLDYTS